MGKTMWLEFLSEQPRSKQGHMKRWLSFLESICWFYILAVLGPLWSWSHWFDSRNYWMLSFWYKGLFPLGCCDHSSLMESHWHRGLFLVAGSVQLSIRGLQLWQKYVINHIRNSGNTFSQKKTDVVLGVAVWLTALATGHIVFYAWSCSWTKKFL
jgi:hypothetical protein